MARKPNPTDLAEQIVRFNPGLVWPGHGCPATDMAVGGFDYSEFFLEQDAAMQASMLQVRLQAEAEVHRVVSEANAKMADVIGKAGR